MEGRGRGRGGRGDGGGRGRGGDRGGWGGDRGGFSGRGRGQQQRDDHSRGPQFPSGRGGGGGGGDRGFDQGSRQRDGDWACSGCGVNNFARNQECFRCKAHRSGAGGGTGSEGGGYRGGHGEGQRGRGRGDGGYHRGGGRGDGGYHRGGGRGDGGYQRGGGGGRGRGGGGGFRGGREIDWDAMETSSQSSTYSDPAAAELAAQMEKMRLNDLPSDLASEDKTRYSVIPQRINQGTTVGTRGRKITIEVNHVQLKFDPKKTLAIHYDCAFKPDKLSRKVLRKIMAAVKEKRYPNRYPAFDGKKNLYSCLTPLFEGTEMSETIELPAEEGDSRPLKVDVTIKEVDRVDLTLIVKFMNRQILEYPQKPVQVMEIVLRSAPASAGFIQVGRSFFTAPRDPITLGNGLELYHGFFQSVVLGWDTFLNVDVAHKGFPEGGLVSDLMCEFKTTGRDPKPHPSELKFYSDELQSFIKHIKGLRVQYAIPGVATSRRKHTVNGVKRPANQQTFLYKKNDNDRGKEITIQQYMTEKYNCRLKFPNLPCLHVGDPKKNPPTCVPAEFCTLIPGQVTMKKLDPDQTRQMIRQAAQPPSDRKAKTINALEKTNFMQDGCIREFGVSVGQQFISVPARILTPPTIVYDQRTSDPANGEWRVQQFKQATSLDKWAIASAGFCGVNDLRQIVDRFRSVSSDVGMTVSEPYRTDVLVQDPRRMTDADLERILLQAFHKYVEDKVQIVVMLIPDKSYDIVKQVAELRSGLLTQCIMEKTMRRMDASTGKNLLLKINAKLNGVNHTVTRNAREKIKNDRVLELMKGTMLMGADVTHPSPDQKDIPSVAAVTASHDPMQFQYNMVWRLQPPKQEIIGELQTVVIEQLRYYKAKNNGKAPERIIFYRDGVSEGQFIQVLQVEMTCVKWACRQELGRELPVTFLVVQKRHHTRFFPTDKSHMDRKGNVPPGTVVDTKITHSTEADFYMVSHASLQGTSRPTKYHKLWDDNEINEDDLEELTFFLCHMFSRCTRSVSYPAPTYYAHLAAARGKVYLQGARINIEKLAMEMERRTIHNNIINGSPMFFT